jgi:hypothetical protein
VPTRRSTRSIAALAFVGILTVGASSLLANPAFAKGGVAPAPAPGVARAIGGGGSGKTAPVALPKDWPADVPAPAFPLTGVTGAAGHWVIAFTVPGDATNAAAYLQALYAPAGFTPDPNFFVVLRSARYTITVAMSPKDHTGPLNENVVLQLVVN